MNTEEQLTQVQKLLKLKRYEQPPPGYFDRLPGQIISRIEREQAQSETWFLRLWRTAQAKPAFAGAFGLAMCGLVVGGVLVANQAGQGGRSAVAAQDLNTNLKGAPESLLAHQPVMDAASPASSTNPVLSSRGLDGLFNGSLVSSGAFPNIERPAPVNVQVPKP